MDEDHGVISMDPSIWKIYDYKSWDDVGIEQKNFESIVTVLFKAWNKYPSILKYDFTINNAVSIKYCDLVGAIRDPHLSFFIENQPDHFFQCLAISFHMYLLPSVRDSFTEGVERFPDRIYPRLVECPKVSTLVSLRSTSIDTFVTVRGTVVRVSNIRPILVSVEYRCSKCHASWRVACKDGTPISPVKCVTLTCNQTLFTIDRDTAMTTDWQRIRLQEITDCDSRGHVPITRDVEVRDFEVDCCVPGDVITVSGIVRVVSISDNRGAIKSRAVGSNYRYRTSRKRTSDYNTSKNPIYDIYIEAISVCNPKNVFESRLMHRDVIELSLSEMYGVLQIANNLEGFALICASLCPSIYGHHLVKAGLVLALFGGCFNSNDDHRSSIRSDIHVLIVGDPGLGKSQLLISISNLAPRGIYVCGSYASASGLTVSIHKQAGSDYSLEAGALVLANNGIACIDELDKISNDMDALLEAMEQQQISVAKAGIVCNLPAKSSILAAANPRHGHYNKNKTVIENLNMSSALLSRFDLIFVLLDRPDSLQDELVTNHIIAQHSVKNTSVSRVVDESGMEYPEFTAFGPNTSTMDVEGDRTRRRGQYQRNSSFSMGNANGYEHCTAMSLSDRLSNFDPTASGIIPPALLNRYITYARKYVDPKLTEEAKKTLQEFYMKLRKSERSQDGTPVTTRQLESLIRLAEARAKVELREEATQEDALDVIEIMKSSLRDAIDCNTFNDLGSVNVGMTGKRGRNKIAQTFAKKLQLIAKNSEKYEWKKNELYELAKEWKIHIPLSTFDDIIELLNIQGYLLKGKNRTWKVCA